ncbi:MAG: phosphoribosylglycinamide synthetase C domain-containing protein, partial [Leadbetterella sp.]
VVAGGYPEEYRKNDVMEIPSSEKGSIVFHAGTKSVNGQVLSNGGRVISLTGLAKTLPAAIKKSQKLARSVKFKGRYFRKDIGQDVLQFLD